MAKRKFKCNDCGEAKPDVKLVDCPYDSDVHGKITRVRLCDDCCHERYMDV